MLNLPDAVKSAFNGQCWIFFDAFFWPDKFFQHCYIDEILHFSLHRKSCQNHGNRGSLRQSRPKKSAGRWNIHLLEKKYHFTGRCIGLLGRTPNTSLSLDHQAKLELSFTLGELHSTSEAAAASKAPGLHGLSYEFYKATFGMVGLPLLDGLNAMLNCDFLSPSLPLGVVRLLPKVPGVPKASQLRPITPNPTSSALRPGPRPCWPNRPAITWPLAAVLPSTWPTGWVSASRASSLSWPL